METNVGLQTLGKTFEDWIHVDAICVGPSVLKIFLETLAEGVRDLWESRELNFRILNDAKDKSFGLSTSSSSWTFIAKSQLKYLMKSYKLSNSQHLCVITCCARIKSLNNRWNITEDAGVHQSCGNNKKLSSSSQFFVFHSLSTYIQLT
jgi:hypothetical protein